MYRAQLYYLIILNLFLISQGFRCLRSINQPKQYNQGLSERINLFINKSNFKSSDFNNSMIKDYELAFEPISHANTKLKCGCYALNEELLKQRPNQMVLIPLKVSEYHVEISNSIANITLTQKYQNPTNQFLEIEYNFPVNPDACIYRFVAQFAQTRMEGVIKEKEEAKLQYQQAVKEGKKAAYGELNAQSKDIMTLKVGNVPPKETVSIEISYLQELTLSCNTFYQLHMVGTISPRYLNYIPGQDLAAGFRNQAAKSQGRYYWDFKIVLKTSRKVIFFDSNTHDIELVAQNNNQTESQFAMTKACVPNKDFCFSYTTEYFEQPSYVFGRTDAGSTAMISFVPRFCTLSINDAYKASVAGKGFETQIEHAKGEYVFLLDRSGSMSGTRIEKAKQALILFIKSLPQDTYFNVISFGSGSERMFQNSVKYTDKEIKSATEKVKTMYADMGGTEIYQPLFNLITQKPIEGYPKQIFLLTDGGVSNTEGVITMVGVNNKYSRVHTIGIGNGCSEALILGCAKKGKGHHVFISDDENPSEKIIQILSESLSPVVSQMRLDYDKSVVESIIPNPESMPYVLKGEIVNFYITFKGQLDRTTVFSFSYQDSLNKKLFKSEIMINPDADSSSFIDRMGHFKRIRLLEDSNRTNSAVEDMMYYVKVVDKKAEIIKQSVKHQILSEFTAFVCVEKELVDGKYQEIKDKGQLKVQIQNVHPQEYEEEYRLQDNRFNSLSSVQPMMLMKCSARAPPQTFAANDRSFQIKQAMDICRSLKDTSSSIFLSQAKVQKKSGCMGGGGGSSAPRSSAREQSYQPAPKAQESQKVEKKKQSVSLIDSLIAEQSADGSWKDIALVGKLLGKQTEKLISKQPYMIALVTYLVAKWIEKHHPEKQYSLVIKKGLNFVRQHVDNYQKFGQLYDQYIK